MKSGILTIMKKELARFFGDKRTVAGVLLPGVMIYVLYSFMGTAMGSVFGVEEDYVPSIQAVRLPQSIAALADSAGMALTEGEEAGLPAAMDQVAGQELDLLVVFPEDFDQAVADYSVASGEPAPHVEVYYSSVSTASQSAYMAFTGLLDSYESLLANKFDVNAREGVYDLATAEESTGALFAMLMPMLLMMFLYSGCSAVAPESIAGEKERGTIATMLVTPIRRSDIAVGKILALAVITVLSGASSALGTILSLPNLMGGAAGEMNANIYGVRDYLLLAAVILSTVLLLVTLVALLSAFAKTVKEAQTYAVPLMILVMVLGITGMFGGGASQNLAVYAIPLYNSVQCIVGIFSFSLLGQAVALTAAVNGAATLLGVFVLTRMFNSEGIIFGR
ncbi:MAG: ABC transporter permease [Oscillospiraceae bacterium]|nr:ABC transporter permease [Oscillospiraceae bacterium]